MSKYPLYLPTHNHLTIQLTDMKKRIIWCMLALLMAGGIQAQEKTNEIAEQDIVNKNWNGFKLAIEGNEYRVGKTMTVNGDMQSGTKDVTSVTVGYARGIALSQKRPIYLETGIGMKWGYSSVDEDELRKQETGLIISEETFSTFSFEVPINISYKIALGREFSMIPYTGLYMRLHVSGNLEGKSNRGNYKYDIFNEEEMEPAFKRFQTGWQLGLDFQYRKFTFGWGYGIDLNKAWKNTRVHTSAFNVGYRF